MSKATTTVRKYVFITGGIVSSLGKGITAASIGFLLSRRDYQVCLQKMDPYLNVAPGTMSPYQHGELYVTEDGTETALDLGHYERIAEVYRSHKEAGSLSKKVKHPAGSLPAFGGAAGDQGHRAFPGRLESSRAV